MCWQGGRRWVGRELQHTGDVSVGEDWVGLERAGWRMSW